ncbi:hypothetical protein Tco_0812274 [Tanacetum coccineum]
MNERCSVVLLNKPPLKEKEKDPRSFTNPCQVLEKHKEAEDLVTNYLSRFEKPHMEVLTEREIADKFSDEHLMVLKSNASHNKEVNQLEVDPEPGARESTPPMDKENTYAFKLCAYNIMRRCVAGSETLEILAHCHSGPTGGHHSANVTAKKVYECGFYWPSVFKNANKYLNELAELRDGAYENTRIYKERTKKWHDSRLRGDKDFKVKIDDPNITIEEYIRLEEEKARRRGKVYNWEIATYGKIWDNEDVHDLGSVETEFPSIVFNDTLTSEAALSCEPMISSLNNEIDFRISFDESDDEDCTVIFDKISFSYKIFFVNNLKTDSENDNDKVNMPLLPSPEPMVSYFYDLDYFKDFEKEFHAIVYNDAQTSKSDLLTEPILNPQHIDEFNLKDETSLSECDEEEQNILNFNDLFPFNVIYPNDSKTDKDNDDNKVDIEHSSGDLSVKPLPDLINTDVGAYAHGSNKLLEIRPREGNIDEYWWRIYKSGNLEVLES